MTTAEPQPQPELPLSAQDERKVLFLALAYCMNQLELETVTVYEDELQGNVDKYRMKVTKDLTSDRAAALQIALVESGS